MELSVFAKQFSENKNDNTRLSLGFGMSDMCMPGLRFHFAFADVAYRFVDTNSQAE